MLCWQVTHAQENHTCQNDTVDPTLDNSYGAPHPQHRGKNLRGYQKQTLKASQPHQRLWPAWDLGTESVKRTEHLEKASALHGWGESLEGFQLPP